MSMKRRTVVVGYDLSETSEEAVRVALSEAGAAREGDLHVVHVVSLSIPSPGFGLPPLKTPDSMRESLHAAKRQVDGFIQGLKIPSNVSISLHVVAGKPDNVLVEVADDVEADLIVVGTHGRTGVNRMLLGSVAEQVVRRAPCSVLTARPRRPTAAESIEPPCPECAAASERAGAQAWCEQHTRRRPRAHTYRETPPSFGMGSLTFRFPQ